MRDDLPIARIAPSLPLFHLPVIDMLVLSPICFTENPYHCLVKDYKLVRESLNDPVATLGFCFIPGGRTQTHEPLNQRFDQFPLAAGKPAANARHVDCRLQSLCVRGENSQAFPKRIVADWRHAVAGANVPLGNHACHPGCLDLYKANVSEAEPSFPFFIEVFRFLLGRAIRDGQDEARAPRAHVVADIQQDTLEVVGRKRSAEDSEANA